MFKVIGEMSGKIYVTGTRADCFRELNKQYPYKKQQDTVYQEVLLVVKIEKEVV
ncbi:hypothetical protein NSA56_11385 [Oceanobacillus caeni]|uniref:hypothetical protein n=1 Tax=Oceanobacillus caeni TaxID=405946 RepID=UPI002149CAF0|nr:hypothetical protein [Oceanobacillus caeni]MCR1834998.1 hypothetical protein [Oceanobacillus caeni]